ncbi:hypothetical protein RFI_16655, partial [Reticulomyxa filosa]
MFKNIFFFLFKKKKKLFVGGIGRKSTPFYHSPTNSMTASGVPYYGNPLYGSNLTINTDMSAVHIHNRRYPVILENESLSYDSSYEYGNGVTNDSHVHNSNNDNNNNNNNNNNGNNDNNNYNNNNNDDNTNNDNYNYNYNYNYN